MTKMKQWKTIGGVPGLFVVALIAVGCRESVAPAHRTPGGPEAWLIEPPAPPPSPPPMKPSLVVTLLNKTARARLPGCGVDPLFADESTIAADVAVLHDPGHTITAVTVALGENPGGSLCGTTMADVGDDGVAHFTLGVAVAVPPPMCALLGSCTYTLTASAEGAEGDESDEFTITVVVRT